MVINGFLVRKVMLATFLANRRQVSLTFLRSSCRSLPEVQVMGRKVNSTLPLQRSRCLTTSLSTHRGTRASALEADAGTEAGGHGAVRNTGMRLDELTQRLDCGTIKLIDVREPDEIEETGSIPTSVNIPLAQLKSALQMTEVQFWQKFSVKKPRKDDTDIVFYGLSPVTSATAVAIACDLGFQWAQHYIGGWQEWLLKCRC